MLSMSDAVPALGAFIWELRGKPGAGRQRPAIFDRRNAVAVDHEDLIKAFVRKYPAFGQLSIELLSYDNVPHDVLKANWESELHGAS